MTSTPMADPSESDRLACEDVVLRFTAHFDAFEHEEMERYFAPDALWARHDGDICGLNDLRERMARRPANAIVRHMMTNLRTTLLSPGHAVVESYVLVFRHQFPEGGKPPAPLGVPTVMGRYHDRLVRLDGAWKIMERRSTIDFASKG